MSKKLFAITWPFILLLGHLVSFKIIFYLINVGGVSDIPQMYMFYFFNGPYVSYTYTVFAFSALIISLIMWFRRPGIWTLLGTVITAWGLCGAAFMYIIIIFHWSRFGYG